MGSGFSFNDLFVIVIHRLVLVVISEVVLTRTVTWPTTLFVTVVNCGLFFVLHSDLGFKLFVKSLVGGNVGEFVFGVLRVKFVIHYGNRILRIL